MDTDRTILLKQELAEIKVHLVNAQGYLEVAKRTLYQLTPTSKLFDPQFEKAKQECGNWLNQINEIMAEIERIQIALNPDPELPFNE